MSSSITATRQLRRGSRLSEWSDGIRLVWLPLILGWLDIVVTLMVQPAGYWGGDYSLALDFNPLVVAALKLHPSMALVGAVSWAAVILVLMTKTEGSLRAFAYAFLVVGHSVCVAGWVLRQWPEYHALVWMGTITVSVIGWPRFVRAGARSPVITSPEKH